MVVEAEGLRIDTGVLLVASVCLMVRREVSDISGETVRDL